MKKTMLVIISLGLLVLTRANGSFLERLSLQVDYGYSNWETVFDSLSITTIYADSVVEYGSTQEYIDWSNEHYDFYNRGHNFGLGLGAKLTEWLRLDAGAGLAFLGTETYDVDYEETPDTNERMLDLIFINHKPGFYVSGDLNFHLPLYKGFFVSALPGISYTHIQNMHAVDPDHDGWIAEDYTVHQDMLAWNADLITGYDFDWLSVYIGGRYMGFRQHVDFDETEDYFGEEITYDRETFLKPGLSFAGLAGVRIPIGVGNALCVEAAIGKGLAITTGLQFGL
jgi:hypothetical protein